MTCSVFLLFSSSALALKKSHIVENGTAQALAPTGWGQILVPIAPGDEVLGSRGESHSQVGQDMLVQSLLRCKRNGFFVDLAANDAVKLSNTLMLERDFQWNGICVEA